jgi:hypothetical protein
MTALWPVALLAFSFTIFFLVVYYYGLRPEVYKTSGKTPVALCPKRWNYNSNTKMCVPAYDTKCMPFDPMSPAFSSAKQKCKIAKACATEWDGIAC